jgi:hypothetical protein
VDNVVTSEYEYLVHTLRHTENQSAVLNKFGRDGWKLVSVLPYSGTSSMYSVVLYMRRPVPLYGWVGPG